MTANVKTVIDQSPRKGALIHLDDGSQPLWTPEYDVAVALVGKPIPEGWTVRQGDYGPQALPPRPKGGGGGFAAAYRNTKDGFEAEAAGRARWQAVEEERRDRRTALMQAVETYGSRPPNMRLDQYIEAAELFYDWLRESSSQAVGEAAAAAKPTPGSNDPEVAPGPGVSSDAPGPTNYPEDWPKETR